MSAIDLGATPGLAARTRLQVDPVTGQQVLLYPEGVLVLNDTARDIVERCNGSRTLAEILESLASEYEASTDELRPDVMECIAQLVERNLLVLK